MLRLRQIFLTCSLVFTLAACSTAVPAPQQRLTASGTQRAGNPDVKVWVNTNSGVYHCPGTRWYGNTKQGQYMTQKQAQSRGYRPAYGNVCG